MEKVYLVITHWEYELEDGIRKRVAKTFEKAKKILEEEKENEDITREMMDYDNEEYVDIMQDETSYFASDDNGNYINIYIEEKEIEE